ncbi:hypothetical protein Pyn_09275 [Prunus yedoensis var. nudiflora]|uniref:Uncharacterized protein n=1 Tax=Prunus yedoensis var. nudiflora TaxID=2094558 RepID=A0A314UVF4_PRUYE|nr:hypothetical protein Pyn_09275 [Prunus yedoensis var. nudiflora]
MGRKIGSGDRTVVRAQGMSLPLKHVVARRTRPAFRFTKTLVCLAPRHQKHTFFSCLHFLSS